MHPAASTRWAEILDRAYRAELGLHRDEFRVQPLTTLFKLAEDVVRVQSPEWWNAAYSVWLLDTFLHGEFLLLG